MASSQLQLAPEVLDRLHQLQQADRPVSVDEILQAANLNHLALPVQQPTQSKSAETRMTKRQPQDRKNSGLTIATSLRLEKSTSTLTLAERRRIPVSPKKLKLYAQISSSSSSLPSQQSSSPSQTDKNDDNNAKDTTAGSTVDRCEQMKKLEKENAKLPPQGSEEYLLSHLERQNALLQADPKSISMEANRLQADFETLKQLVTDNSTVIPQVGLLSSPDMINQMDGDTSTSASAATIISDWDFWQCLVDDFSTAVAKLPHLVSAKLRYGGIPHPLRGVMWQAMAQSSSTRLEIMYDSLVNNADESPSPYARVIQRDLSRTFPTVDMFKCDGGQGQQAMERILISYSMYDVQVGYCQGLAFLVGPLLMTMPEKQAFCVFVRLMETYEMRTMFTLNMEGLHLRLHQFQTLLSQFCPRLDAHLANHSIHPAMYASQWYLTLFAYSLPIHVVMRIYDLVFAEGAVETITRVAIAVMQKNEETLLEIQDFEQLMMYLSSKKLYETAYQSDAEAVIADTMALSPSITKAKMDNIAKTHDSELEQEKTRAHQVLAIRFGGWKRNSTTNGGNNNDGNESIKSPTTSTSKRDSWFPWRENKAPALVQSPTSPTTPSTPIPVSSLSSSSSMMQPPQPHPMDRTVPVLHKQIEELVIALSQLQKEHSHLTEQVMTMKMNAMDYTSANEKLVERNSVLTQRLKKYKQQHRSSSGAQTFASASSFNSYPPLSPSPCSMDTTFSSLVDKANASRLQVLEKDQEFCSFVSSLRMTGDFGSLIASALSTTNDGVTAVGHNEHLDPLDMTDADDDEDDIVVDNNNAQSYDDDHNDVLDDMATLSRTSSPHESTDATTNTTNTTCDDNDTINKVDAITQELVTVKLANFEMGQKYESMCHQNESLSNQLTLSQGKEQMYLDQMAVLEKVRADQTQEIDTMVKANESLSERIMAAKQTSAELHMEKLTLVEQVTQLESHVRELEREKQEYLKPRDSFTEEVFAAHHTLFGEGSVFHQQQRDSTTTTTMREKRNSTNSNGNNEDYQRKYVDSEIRCRELEKLLAEAKCRLVEYETTPAPTQKRPTSLVAMGTNKSSSNNIHGLVLTTRGNNNGGTAMVRDDSTATRVSTDSMSTTTSSKRSSVYSRLWNSIASPTTPSSTDALPFNTKANDTYHQQQQPTIVQSDLTSV
ncbi:rab-GTPase-TBC domain-domain-containing protein [Absidia repens]|uniref:Rab-GTPase-TBC domain-domain-containing protein n=1 Tax=Absidia repens TaxID=90262 RepID=A0A1X2IC33_9FUNG|nr:rab-GTPase-TBC domain-domain-containing protein [Absidia repens]